MQRERGLSNLVSCTLGQPVSWGDPIAKKSRYLFPLGIDHACWGSGLDAVACFFFALSAELFFFLVGLGSLLPPLLGAVGVR